MPQSQQLGTTAGPFRVILVPVDGSELCRQAAAHGLRLAARCKADLVAVAAVGYRPDAAFNRGVGACGPYEDEFRRHLQSLADAGTALSVAVRTYLREGEPDQVIAEVAALEAVDLILMPARAEGPLLAALFRHTQDRVLRAAPCPVLLYGPLSLGRVPEYRL